MKKTTIVMAALFALAAVAPFARAQAGAADQPEKDAAIQTALDYSDGAYSGDAARMERALHPDLNKLIFRRGSPAMGLMATY